MTKRWIAFVLLLMLLAGCALPAQAGVTSLDKALSRWLQDQTSVRFSATMQLKALLPFDDTTIGLLNGVLKHTTLNAAIRQNGDDSDTTLNIAMDSATLMSLTEKLQSGNYTLETSLLPNRVLTSGKASPIDLLAAPEEAAPTAIAETAATDKKKETSVNASDITQAFSMLDAVTELQGNYQTLTDGIKGFATEKRANYNIKGIGAGKWSRIARLTDEQSAGLQSELRAVLSSGMDEIYRAEIEQATFEKGFIVALYQNADNQDICVYLKGNLVYPDGAKRRLVWQWAFNTNGLKRKDTFKYEVTTFGGAADSRLIDATCTQESRSDLFTIDGKTEATLKRVKITDKSTVRIDLSGERGESNTLTCKGDVSQELAQTLDGETSKTTEKTAVDLLFTPDADGSVLSGTISYQKLAGKVAQTAIDISLATNVAAQAKTGGESTAPELTDNGVTVNIVSRDGATNVPQQTESVDASTQVSSLEQITDDLSTVATATAAPDNGGEYLVGSAPIGLKAYAVPSAMATVSLDQAGTGVANGLLAEAAQNFAGKLILAIAALPQEDATLLKDGMTDADYAAFLALLEAL